MDDKNEKVVNAKPLSYENMPKGVGVTKIQNRKEGMQEFLNRDDTKKAIDIDRLRE